MQRSELKNGESLDGRHFQDSQVAIASLFGVVSAVLRQKFKEGEAGKYRWLVDAINSLKIGKNEVETSDIDIRPESSGTDLRDQLKAACDTASAIEREKDRLKAHLDQAQRQLQPWSKLLGTLKKMRRENTPCLILHTGLNTFNVIYLIECAVQLDATLLANNFQHCWMLHVASV